MYIYFVHKYIQFIGFFFYYSRYSNIFQLIYLLRRILGNININCYVIYCLTLNRDEKKITENHKIMIFVRDYL